MAISYDSTIKQSDINYQTSRLNSEADRRSKSHVATPTGILSSSQIQSLVYKVKELDNVNCYCQGNSSIETHTHHSVSINPTSEVHDFDAGDIVSASLANKIIQDINALKAQTVSVPCDCNTHCICDDVCDCVSVCNCQNQCYCQSDKSTSCYCDSRGYSYTQYYTSRYSFYGECTCNTVCDCNSVCNCNFQCSCNSHTTYYCNCRSHSTYKNTYKCTCESNCDCHNVCNCEFVS